MAGRPRLLIMRYWLYDTALTLAAPFGAAYLAASPRHRAALGRFSPRVAAFSEPPLWIHACSVGEVSAAQTIIAALQQRHPECPILLSTTTVTGHDRALQMKDGPPVAWFPVDHPFSVSRFLQRAKPRALALIETELWPNVLRMTARRGIPAIVVNGRLSDRHYRRYQRVPAFTRDMVSRLTAAGVQDQTYADRFNQLGLSSEKIEITGNIKFDGVPNPPESAEREPLRRECGIPPEAPVLVFGSTRPGDESLALECWRALRRDWPGLRVVVAPRHTERVPEIRKLVTEPLRLRSQPQSAPQDSEIIIVDTHGELIRFYSIATTAIVGGSFDAAIQGHNPIEPAAMGVPTVFGPHMRNFAGAAESLAAADAAIQLTDAGELRSTLHALLSDGARRDGMGDRGQAVVRANRGALDKTIDLIERTVLSTTRTSGPG